MVDEAELEPRSEDRVAQLLDGRALEILVKREAVPQDGARDEGGVGRQPGVVGRVEVLREGLRPRRGGDVVANRGIEGGQLESRHDLAVDRLEGRVEVMHVHRVRLGRVILPQTRNRLRHQPQHSAHALEVGERRKLVGQYAHQGRMKWIAALELRGAILVLAQRRQIRGVRRPESPIGPDHLPCAVLVDVREQAPAENLRGLLLGRRIEQRGLPRGDLLGLLEPPRDLLVLGGVRVEREASLADSEGEREGDAR